MVMSDDHVVDLMVIHYHLLSGHSVQEYGFSLIWKSYWTIKGRVAVRRVVNHCFSCSRRQAPSGAQKMADLPADRVTPNKPPFSFVVVNCFGPFWVKRAKSQVKRYGVLFTCLATRAIHLEVTQSMDTDSFVNSMRRFIPRKGTPEFGQWFKFCRRKQGTPLWLKWESDPWFLLQRNMRKILVALMKDHPLDDEGLATLMYEVKSIVNGRPITKSSDAPSDSEAHTPSHLLLLPGQDHTFLWPCSGKRMATPEEDGAKFSIWPVYFGGDGLDSTCRSCKRGRNGRILQGTSPLTTKYLWSTIEYQDLLGLFVGLPVYARTARMSMWGV